MTKCGSERDREGTSGIFLWIEVGPHSEGEPRSSPPLGDKL